MSIKIPSFLKFTNKYLNTPDFTIEDAHSSLLMSISDLYSQGVSIEKIKQGDILKQLNTSRKLIVDKYHIDSYPSLSMLINYVFTRDEVYNPFGPWVEIPYYLPKAMYNFTVLHFGDQLKKQSIINFSGLIFSLYVFYSKLRTISREDQSGRVKELEYGRESFRLSSLKELKTRINREVFLESSPDDEIFQLYSPNRLYSTAGITQVSFKKYMAIIKARFQIDYQYDVINKEKFSQTLYIKNLTSLINRVNEFLLANEKSHIDFINNFNDLKTSGLDIAKFDRLVRFSRNYESKFRRLKSTYFNIPGMDGNPFFRLGKNNDVATVYCQLYLLNFNILFYSLYAFVNENSSRIKPNLKSEFDHQFVKTITGKSYKNFNKDFNNLVSILNKYSISKKEKPVDSPNNIVGTNTHFDQINRCQNVVNKISKTGIPVDIDKINQLLIEEYNNTKSSDIIVPEYHIDTEEFNLVLNEKDDFSNEIAEVSFEEPENENDEVKSLTKMQWLIKMKASANQFRGTEDRIYGYFIPHGASTHRMTCHNLNLQGIPKSLRNQIYRPSKGNVLLSLDVSGQDLVVAANMARKMYSDSEMNQIIGPERQRELLPLIDSTLISLSNEPKSSPVDYLLNKLEIEIPNLMNLLPLGYERSIVKKCLYINFYGGGPNTILNSFEVPEIGEDIKNIIPQIFKEVIKHVNIEYPGIIDSLPHYKSYSESNGGLTYKTFLGWQTITDIHFKYDPRSLHTKSQSYPIQASGAEFIRQWLLEISRMIGYANNFNIVNVIHDQVILEIKLTHVEAIKTAAIQAAKDAARKIGMIEDSIKLTSELITNN